MLFKILTGEEEPDSGYYKWGVTTTQAYFPKDNTAEFDCDLTIADWLTQYSEIKDVTYVRGFLGRMLFAGEDGSETCQSPFRRRESALPALQDDDFQVQTFSFLTSRPTIWIWSPSLH